MQQLDNVNPRRTSYHKQPPYTCACCGYETRHLASIVYHLNRKKGCTRLPNRVALTDEIRNHIIHHRVYIVPAPPVETPKNVNIQNMVFLNNMDAINKIMKYIGHQNKTLVNFYDHAEGLFSEKDVTFKKPDIIETIDIASSLQSMQSHTKFTTLNVMYDDNDGKIKIYDNEEWHEYLPLKGVQEMINVLQAVYLERYECYLIRKIQSGSESLHTRQRAREDLEEYYKLISAIDKKPYIFERCDSEIMYDTDDDRFGTGVDRYSIEEEFMPLYNKAKNQIHAKETNAIIKEITTILKRNTKNNVRQLDMKIRELFIKDEAFKSILMADSDDKDE